MRPVGEYLTPDYKEPSKEGAALFKRFADEGKQRDGTERKPNIKYTKLTCMGCGVENEFEEVNEESNEICKSCSKPIFGEIHG